MFPSFFFPVINASQFVQYYLSNTCVFSPDYQNCHIFWNLLISLSVPIEMTVLINHSHVPWSISQGQSVFHALLFQNFHGYSGIFVLPKNLESFCQGKKKKNPCEILIMVSFHLEINIGFLILLMIRVFLAKNKVYFFIYSCLLLFSLIKFYSLVCAYPSSLLSLS